MLQTWDQPAGGSPDPEADPTRLCCPAVGGESAAEREHADGGRGGGSLQASPLNRSMKEAVTPPQHTGSSVQHDVVIIDDRSIP